MSYIETLKRLYNSIKNNKEIPEKEKARAKELVDELVRMLAVY